jgi:hypothetical protein
MTRAKSICRPRSGSDEVLMRFQWSIKRLMLAIAAVAVLIALGFEVESCLKRRTECLKLAAYHRNERKLWQSVLSNSETLVSQWAGKVWWEERFKASPDPENTLQLGSARKYVDLVREVVESHERQARRYDHVAARPWLATPARKADFPPLPPARFQHPPLRGTPHPGTAPSPPADVKPSIAPLPGRSPVQLVQ